MRPVNALDIKAGTGVSLSPGGYHIMLIGLSAPLSVGDQVELTLTFENAGKINITAPVRTGPDDATQSHKEHTGS